MGKPTVSVIMPTHNDVKYLTRAIDSVISQSFKDWELLVVDDGSTDGTSDVIAEYCKKERRIKAFRIEKASGSPTKPRNIGIENATGRYIAFLDSDDLWLPTKLEHQMALFEKEDKAAIVFSYYKVISEEGITMQDAITSPAISDYKHLLKGNVIGCLTAIYDTDKVGKQFFPYCGHEDYVVWLSILKKGWKAYNTNTVEAKYQVKESSVSSNKLKAMQWQWNIYRNIEHIGLLKSVYYFIHYAVRAIDKHKYRL